MDRKTGLEYYNSLYSEDQLINAKAKAFDEIASMFYNGNFGSTTKSEFELKMFSILMDAMIDYYTPYGIVNNPACSDYSMAQMLGLPQSTVRTLKVKKQARYPKDFDWKKSLENIKSNIRYDSKKNKIIIPIPDPNLYNEIRNYIEERGGYIEIQRGNNVIQIRPEYYFLLLYEKLDDFDQKYEIRKSIANQLKSRNEVDIKSFTEDESYFKTQVANHGSLIMEIVLNCIENDNLITTSLKTVKTLFEHFKKK